MPIEFDRRLVPAHATRFAAGEEYEVKRIGERFADVAAGLLEDALTYLPPVRRLGDVQLRLSAG